jgi:hypothetical protein
MKRKPPPRSQEIELRRLAVFAAIMSAAILPDAAAAAHHLRVPASVAAHGHHRMLGVVRAHHRSRTAHTAGELASSGPTPVAGQANMTYHGGAVLHSNRTYAIYWLPSGTTVASGYQSVINGFFGNVAAASGQNSNVYAVDQQYTDGSGAAANSSAFGGSYVDTQTPIPNDCASEYGSVHVSGCVTDADIEAEASRAIAAAGWTPTSSSIFFVFTPKNVGSCFSGSGGTCAYTYYCAYHSAFTDSHGRTILYANQPYPDTSGLSGLGGSCDAGQHPNANVADATINVASHEHNETITDPFGNAWFDSSGQEIGDKCAWDFGTLAYNQNGGYNQSIGTGQYFMQMEWSNNVSGCLQTYTPPAAPPPTVTSFAPTQGSVGASVTITGTNLSGASAVKFNGTAATSYSVNSATSITVTVPDMATTGPLTVITPGGTVSSSASFTVNYPPPTLSAFTPSSGAAGTIVTINGTNLASTTAVSFNGVHTAFLAISDTAVRAFVPGLATNGPVSVTTPSGSATTKASFTVVPSITALSPGSGPAGTTVTVSGYNFTGATAVTIGGVAATSVSVSSATSLTAVVTSSDVTGPVAVTAGGQTGTSTAGFSVTPAISAVSPVSAAAGATVTITGSNLSGASAVSFGGVAAPSFTVVGPTKVTAVVPGGAASGTVSVTTAGGTATSGSSFGVLPRIDNLSPSTATAGSIVTISGSGLSGASSVTLNGVALGITYDTAGTLQVSIPAAATSGKVTVTTAAGSATSTGALTIAASISSYSPFSVKPGATVTINGSGFNGATAVSFNGAAKATSFHVVSSTVITATVPMMALTGGVLVTTPAGVGAGSFTLTILPVITSVARSTGQSGQVTISGGGFMGTSSVKLNGTALKFTYVNPTTVTATVSSSVTSGAFTLTTPAGTATLSSSIAKAKTAAAAAKPAAARKTSSKHGH